MKRVFHFALIIALFTSGAAAQQPNNLKTAKAEKAAAASSHELVGMLPASDLVAVVDAKRLFSELLPKLSGLSIGGVDRFAHSLSTFIEHTGIDPAKIQSAALGVNMEGLQGTGVLLVKGLDLSGTQVEAAMKELKAEFKAAEYKGKTIYTVTSKVNTPAAGPFTFKSDELALGALGNGLLALGDLRVVKKIIERQAGDAVPGVSQPMVAAVAETRASALLRFAMNIPDQLRTEAADQGDLFKSIASIKLLLGTLDAASDLSLTLDALMRTNSQSDAAELESSLNGLLVLVKGIFGGGGTNNPRTDFLGALLNHIKIGSKLSDVSLTISLPRATLDQLSQKSEKQ
jgi:hypothetical protein